MNDNLLNNRILFCDDEIHIVRALEYKFSAAGFEVVTANNGEDAWEKVLEYRPAILITDYQMPLLNGYELVERIRGHEEHADLPVLMLTAKGFELARNAICGELGVLALIPKPFSPRELLLMVQDVLSGNSPSLEGMLRSAT
ncbi:MAG: response regulator [Pirellulaceae bacterium]|jgi:DNA-binding response OmpR family regulator|nr:response regulator [Pirellulaceae bacterium]MDP7016773.1 response regulator [Pirellulaceae bacterium]